MSKTYTPKLKLAVVDDADTTTTFKDWRVELDGPTNSNMTKIEDAIVEAGNRGTYLGTCSTSGTEVAKVVADCPDFKLEKGARIIVYFQSTDVSSNPTLNVNNTGAYPIIYQYQMGDADDVGTHSIAKAMIKTSTYWEFTFFDNKYLGTPYGVSSPGTLASPIWVTSQELDKTWRSGWYQCEDYIILVTNENTQDDYSYVSQIVYDEDGQRGWCRKAWISATDEWEQALEPGDTDIYCSHGFTEWEPVEGGTLKNPWVVTEEELNKAWEQGWYRCDLSGDKIVQLTQTVLYGAKYCVQAQYNDHGLVGRYRFVSGSGASYKEIAARGYGEWQNYTTAPSYHADTTERYGAGNSTNYGHVKLTDEPSDTNMTEGTALAPKALYDHQQAVGNDTTYGHLCLSDRADKSLDVTQYTAATPKALDDHQQGVGNETTYGHLCLTDEPDPSLGVGSHTAITPKAVSDVSQRLDKIESQTGFSVELADTGQYGLALFNITSTGATEDVLDQKVKATIQRLNWTGLGQTWTTNALTTPDRSLTSGREDLCLIISFDFAHHSTTPTYEWQEGSAFYDTLPKYDGGVLYVKGGYCSWADEKTGYEALDGVQNQTLQVGGAGTLQAPWEVDESTLNKSWQPGWYRCKLKDPCYQTDSGDTGENYKGYTVCTMNMLGAFTSSNPSKMVLQIACDGYGAVYRRTCEIESGHYSDVDDTGFDDWQKWLP